ncbi:MAG: NYN domain-containing protein [Ruminococcus sp.]|nr:NYN domain-containing protein [Ruminococcus sp.]
MKKITLGITAHVDSGKTTLAESMLYTTGNIKKKGRVDSGNSFLDTNFIERNRGISIFSHQAEMTVGDDVITLLDTPGHVDFSAETERTMQVLDYAILVISCTDGVQSHTSTLWKLLSKYEIPVFIFINKTDLTTAEPSFILENIRRKLSENCADFSGTDSDIYESCALCSEDMMNKYIADEFIPDEDIINAVAERRIFPCFFGSALKMQGIEKFISAVSRFTRQPERQEQFGAKVYKISYDSKGSRLTHMKIMGGQLSVRDEVEYISDGEKFSEKISSVRFYSGEKFRTEKSAEAGDICAVTGLENTYSGQGIGFVRNSERAVLEPVMSYRVILPDNINPFDALKDLRRLEDTDPQLHIVWNENSKEIHMQLMGAVQIEVLTDIIKENFGYDVIFANGTVSYRETIRNISEGVGHYEPLKHYAEVHLLLEPLPKGSGLVFAAKCPEDDLDRNWQRLILTHLEEKTHVGILTGSPVTDMKITLMSGKAHLKHTEGGDFRQATYRAVRQGLRYAESVLLEPYFEYELEIPSEYTGRAIADLQHMSAEFDSPETVGEFSIIKGTAPVCEINGYYQQVISYTKGRGHISYTPCGYRECHNAEEIIENTGYDCDGDVENSADSVFCSHGAGFIVKWNEVYSHMHLPSCLKKKHENDTPKAISKKTERPDVSEKELMEIFERTYGKINRDPRKAFSKTKKESDYSKPVKLPDYEKPDYLIVDGYNIIFAWDNLKKAAEESLDAARSDLINILSNYQGYSGYEIVLVFDAYKVKGNRRHSEKYININIVYTQENETADSYIEKLSHDLSKKHRVRVATSDNAEQMIIFGGGAMRISANELKLNIENAEKQMREKIK